MGPGKPNHPGIAAVLSFVFNGLGQLYNGQISKGLLIIFISAVGMLALLIGAVLIGLWLLGRILSLKVLILGLVLFLGSMVFICVLGVFSIRDAYRTALKQ